MASFPRQEIDRMKAQLALSEIIGRHVRLSPGGRGDRFGLCPFHDEKGASFTVNDSKGFFHCFGCHAHGDVLDWWQRFEKLSFADAVERLRREAGGERTPTTPIVVSPLRVARQDQDDPEMLAKAAAARRIWQAASPIAGTIAETYLRQARRISVPLPDCIRFHPGGSEDPAPMMVASVVDLDRNIVAIQRTYLKPDGSGKAPLLRPKKALGPVGRGAVCLAPAATELGVAEGIETGLSAMELFRLPVWCALGSNLARVVLPDTVRKVVIFADRGHAGEAAAIKARDAFHSQQRKVSVRFSNSGSDFNDELREMRRRG